MEQSGSTFGCAVRFAKDRAPPCYDSGPNGRGSGTWARYWLALGVGSARGHITTQERARDEHEFRDGGVASQARGA